jgi:hypothetical protein
MLMVLLSLVVDQAVADPLVGAIYFGDWHVDPQMSAVHYPNWTEMDIVLRATPRFPGHLQPNVPLEDPDHGFGVNVSEADASVMEKKIDSAVEHGVGMFLFDWYWYASPTHGGLPDLQGSGGGPFLAGALENGFLKASNRQKMDFALMWANQDWVDIHPAKKGFNGCYRQSKSDPISGPGAQNWQLQLFDGYMNATVYRNAFKYIAETYFTQPNYYRVPTKLANGTTAQCCFFSFYQPEYVADGNRTEAIPLMDEFRAAAVSVGQCLHLNHMTSPDALLKPRKVDSRTDYGWIKLGHSPAYKWPQTAYEDVMDHSLSEIAKRTALYSQNFSIPYIPSLSPGFDSSPRTLPSDGWDHSFGYPWGLSWTSNITQWKTALTRTKQLMGSLCNSSSERWCPPLLINAWNEWSEGAYLEPDQRYGMGRLEAIKAIFGPHGPALP